MRLEAFENARKAKDVRKRRIWRIVAILGPGLITGAADDDPSGIATYSRTGAQHRGGRHGRSARRRRQFAVRDSWAKG
jgi:hypothetical protein